MAKKNLLPLEFTKYKPIETPSRMMYVRIEALIPVFDGNGELNTDEIRESVENAADDLSCYGTAFVTAQFEVEEDECTATEMLRSRRQKGDISGETC